MPLSRKAASEIREAVATIPETGKRISRAVIMHHFVTKEAREHAFHGLLRRLRIMERCIARINKLLPPGRTKPPREDQRLDAEICLHAFIANVSGCLDNLAWIWVHEKAVTGANGKTLKRSAIGFRQKHERLYASLPINLRAHLDGMADWLAAAENYRDALAHRIPLYIPPYGVRDRDAANYANLEARIDSAALHGDHRAVAELEAESQKLRFFDPLMIHSYSEGSRPLVFHAQIIADYRTIDELTKRLLMALGLP